MSKPIVFCKVCETHMFEVDLDTHNCTVRKLQKLQKQN